MKKFACLLVWFCFGPSAFSQKPAIGISGDLRLDEWPGINGGKISNNGKYVLYQIANMPAGSSTLVIRSTDGNWERQYPQVERGFFSDNSRMVFFQHEDSLWTVRLGTEEKHFISNIQSFAVAGKGGAQWVIYRTVAPDEMLVFRSMNAERVCQVKDVETYHVNDEGTGVVCLRKSKDLDQKSDTLSWHELGDLKDKVIWTGIGAHNYVFSENGQQVAFLVSEKRDNCFKNSLWYYQKGMDSAQELVSNSNPGISCDLVVANETPTISKDGDRIFFRLNARPHPDAGSMSADVDVWTYRDVKLQSEQLTDIANIDTYGAVVQIKTSSIFILQRKNEQLILPAQDINGQYAVAYTNVALEGWWNKGRRSFVYLVNLKNGARKLLVNDSLDYVPAPTEFKFSPGGRWILFFNRQKKCWYSYDAKRQSLQNICKGIRYPVYDEWSAQYAGNYSIKPLGIAGWMKGENVVLIYDDYDIWLVDLTASHRPFNVTMGFGRSHGIKFRLALSDFYKEHICDYGDTLVLSAFDVNRKNNGFYRKVLVDAENPQRLCLGPYILYAQSNQLLQYSRARSIFIQKAKASDKWILMRRSATQAPNLILTENFKAFKALSDIQPQQGYNWLTTELVNWTMTDGKKGTGILFKPGDFDKNKKYPLILLYYEQLSDNLNDYPAVEWCNSDVNIPYFTSRGYLIFEPDIIYKIGHPGESAVNSIVSAALYLSHRPYVDGKHMGISGHSFGGFETNYLITHTHLFAAAAEAAGLSDYCSGYGNLGFGIDGNGFSMEFYDEIGQGRIGASLWGRPDLYLENSPVLEADKVTTPLLMMSNKWDGSAPFNQPVEMFTALRRLDKPVWLLQYDKEGHVLGDLSDQKDYTVRLEEFFNHFLKGDPAPDWIIDGIPARWKGVRSGY